MALLYNILVKFMVLFYYYYYFLFPGIATRYMAGDCEFYVYTCKCLIQKKKTGCLSKLYYLLAAQACSFYFSRYHHPFPNTASQATPGSLHLIEQPLCDLRDNMPPHWPPSASHLTLADGSRANLLPTKKYYSVGSIYVLGMATEYYISLSLVLNSLHQ